MFSTYIPLSVEVRRARGSQAPAEVQSCHQIVAALVHVSVFPLRLPGCGPGRYPLPVSPARSVDVCSCGDCHLLLRRSQAGSCITFDWGINLVIHQQLVLAYLRSENVFVCILEPGGLTPSLSGCDGSAEFTMLNRLVNNDNTRYNLATGFV